MSPSTIRFKSHRWLRPDRDQYDELQLRPRRSIFGRRLLEDVAVLGAALLVVNYGLGSPGCGQHFRRESGLEIWALFPCAPLWQTRARQVMVQEADGQDRPAPQRGTGLAITEPLPFSSARAVLGTRLPTYLAAGLLEGSSQPLFTFTGVACLIWVAALF